MNARSLQQHVQGRVLVLRRRSEIGRGLQLWLIYCVVVGFLLGAGMA